MADDDTKRKNGRKGQPVGSVDAFWEDHSKLHTFKQLFDGLIELGFLAKGCWVLHKDRNLTCEDTYWNEDLDIERMRIFMQLMIFIHALHLARLIFSLYSKYGRKAQGACRGCLRCLLVDCYCCTGTAVYLYT